MRVLSGIQPTGRPHWGNFFGAIRQYIDLQEENDGFYFIADLHALTTIRNADELRQNTLDAALDLPEVSELTWLLMTGAPMGLLERCHAYKEKKAKGIAADAGLFTYPVLMASDILAYDSEVVAVGADQVQHIEVCRDLAGSFNRLLKCCAVFFKRSCLRNIIKARFIELLHRQESSFCIFFRFSKICKA